MHIITICPRCGHDFMYHTTDYHLHRELPANEEIRRNYPVQDDIHPSRRWNKSETDYCDLSGGNIVICQDCHEKESEDNKCPEQKFCEHIEEWDGIGVPYGTKDLIKLAKKYGCEVPKRINKEEK